MEEGGLSIIKLGGSSITFKERTFSIDENSLYNISSALGEFKGRLLIVHGGGSWGHPVAVAYGLNSFSFSYNSRGASLTRLAMLELSEKVQRYLIDHGINVFFFPPQHLESIIEYLDYLYQLGAVPLTYGDVIFEKGKGYRVIGGDEIIRKLSTFRKIGRVIFIMRTGGILDSNGNVIETISLSGKGGMMIDDVPISSGNMTYTYRQAKAELQSLSSDATGGIIYKLMVAEELASKGTEVLFLSAHDRDNLVKALNGMKFHGTIVIK